MTIETYLVGGAVRDRLLSVPTKDYDFTVVADGGWIEMRNWIIDNGFNIFVETPEYFTIRAHFPKGWEFNGEDMSRLTGDFVLARKEGEYADGRHPDKIEPGTLYDDQARRDFTVNSLAMDEHGVIYDPFGGQADLATRTLRAVGSAEARIREDGLRAIRAIRFSITKQFGWDKELQDAMFSDWIAEVVGNVKLDRRRDELKLCFVHDSLLTIRCLSTLRPSLQRAILAGLWLEPTSRKAK